MTMTSFNRVLLVSVTLVFTLSVSGFGAATTESPVNIRTAAKQLAQDIRTVVAAAKNGQFLELLHQDVLDIENKASELLGTLPGDVSECETNLAIKMAASGTGSHEVLTLLLAEDALSVMNGRLALSLAFLEHLAGQLEAELAMFNDIGPQLAAVAFGANTTAVIIDTADKTVKTALSSADPSVAHNRVRRQSIGLGGGWSAGLGGIKWQSGSGLTTFKVAPKFKGFKPSGVSATLTIRF
ncbi:uncharacterized protein LOC143276668 isoform X2 [Babylonia areolata]|uniref:uncharacterized protein LOC143276668 isoform X2 n=1 Tax=Babylonia areolata TaxID=304850 RepID=UPI003FD604E8